MRGSSAAAEILHIPFVTAATGSPRSDWDIVPPCNCGRTVIMPLSHRRPCVRRAAVTGSALWAVFEAASEGAEAGGEPSNARLSRQPAAASVSVAGPH